MLDGAPKTVVRRLFLCSKQLPILH